MLNSFQVVNILKTRRLLSKNFFIKFISKYAFRLFDNFRNRMKIFNFLIMKYKSM